MTGDASASALPCRLSVAIQITPLMAGELASISWSGADRFMKSYRSTHLSTMGSNSLLVSATLIARGDVSMRAYFGGTTFGPKTGLPSGNLTIRLHSTVIEYSPDGAPSSA